MIYLLLVGLILELIYCYYVFEKDLFSPSAILCEVFILSTIACIFNIDKWGVNLSANTVAVVLLGHATFIAVSTMIHKFYKKKYGEHKNKKDEKLTFIKIAPIVLALVIIAYITFSTVFIVNNVSIMKGLTQSTDIAEMMSSYRYETVHGDGVSLSPWLARLSVIFSIGNYILIYVFVNNMIVDRKNKSNYVILFAVIAFLISSAFTAQRTTILLAFIYTLFVVYSLLNRQYHFVEKINTKYVFRGAIIVIVFLVLFGFTRGLFGRKTDGTVIDSVTYYMGNSIESLDLFVKNPLESKQFGEETFRQFRINLSKYGLVEDSTMETPHLEFRRDANGNSAGNIYTAYRYYIHDFGYGPIVLFQVLLAMFYGVWYEKIKYRSLKTRIDLSFILYAWFCLELFRFSIKNEVFNAIARFLFLYWAIFLFWKLFLNLKVYFNKPRVEDSIPNGGAIPKDNIAGN